jgi:hypothetical protein
MEESLGFVDHDIFTLIFILSSYGVPILSLYFHNISQSIFQFSNFSLDDILLYNDFVIQEKSIYVNLLLFIFDINL